MLGLVILAAGSFAASVHNRLIVAGDPGATVNNIRASEALFRLGIVGGLVMYAVFILYVAVLYRLLKPVNELHALWMLALALVGVPIALASQAYAVAALRLTEGGAYPKAFAADEIPAQVMLLLGLHSSGNLIAVVFWGLWLFPLGLLVFESGFFPRALGVLLMIGCLGWLALFVQRLFFPGYQALAYARFAAHVAELSWILWLLIKGPTVDRRETRTVEA